MAADRRPSFALTQDHYLSLWLTADELRALSVCVRDNRTLKGQTRRRLTNLLDAATEVMHGA
jgi:hypothetical protein